MSNAEISAGEAGSGVQDGDPVRVGDVPVGDRSLAGWARIIERSRGIANGEER
jgi:hypothetical protein